ncbi:hypothetical protein BX600DRAFT_92045 [Xylariales sp. PMI_506]|nr:hypothetical protein BX600DRAFT_92045 [Xylariales sp. PMI_506]
MDIWAGTYEAYPLVNFASTGRCLSVQGSQLLVANHRSPSGVSPRRDINRDWDGAHSLVSWTGIWANLSKQTRLDLAKSVHATRRPIWDVFKTCARQKSWAHPSYDATVRTAHPCTALLTAIFSFIHKPAAILARTYIADRRGCYPGLFG